MTAPCAIEYILVTRWRGGKKGGQNRVCACDTRDRGVNKKLKPEHPSETVVMPESGERKRNLTTFKEREQQAVIVNESKMNMGVEGDDREGVHLPLSCPMTADGIRLTPNPFACLEVEREMEEDRSPDTPTNLASPADNGPAELSFRQLKAFFHSHLRGHWTGKCAPYMGWYLCVGWDGHSWCKDYKQEDASPAYTLQPSYWDGRQENCES